MQGKKKEAASQGKDSGKRGRKMQMELAADAVFYAASLPALAGAGALSTAVLVVADVVTVVCGTY